MRQALHIFRKDARYLWIEISLLILLAALFAWTGTFRYRNPASEIVLEIAALFLIARVIHAEPLLGNRQFWVTRPYDWRSLVGAKLLFIAVFVSGPICAAQLVMLAVGGFTLEPAIPGLLWSQLLIFFVGALVVAAFAALTPGTIVFMVGTLAVAALLLLGAVIGPRYAGIQPSVPTSLQWSGEYLMLAAIAITAAIVLIRMYHDRTPVLSWIALAGGATLALVVYLFMPASLAFATQSLFSGPSSRTIEVSIEPELKGKGTRMDIGRNPPLRRLGVAVPIAIHGVPQGQEVRADALDVSFSWPGKQTWRPDIPPGLNIRSGEVTDATILMEPALYRANRDLPLSIAGSIYLTVFGDAETRTQRVQEHPVNFQDGLQCFAGDFNTLFCRSFFRWPARLVYATSGGTESDFQNTMISYSPFPADTGLSTMKARSARLIRNGEVTITTKRPIAHFWRSIESRSLRLVDLEGATSPLGKGDAQWRKYLFY